MLLLSTENPPSLMSYVFTWNPQSVSVHRQNGLTYLYFLPNFACDATILGDGLSVETSCVELDD